MTYSQDCAMLTLITDHSVFLISRRVPDKAKPSIRLDPLKVSAQ